MLGNAKGVVAVVISLIYFRNPVNFYSVFGYGITVTGVVMYSQVRPGHGCGAWRPGPALLRDVVPIRWLVWCACWGAGPMRVCVPFLQAKKSAKKTQLLQKMAGATIGDDPLQAPHQQQQQQQAAAKASSGNGGPMEAAALLRVAEKLATK